MWFKKKPKSNMDLFEEQLKFYRHCITHTNCMHDASEQLRLMNHIVMEAVKIELNKDLEKRLKSIEDAISDLYLTGRSSSNE